MSNGVLSIYHRFTSDELPDIASVVSALQLAQGSQSNIIKILRCIAKIPEEVRKSEYRSAIENHDSYSQWCKYLSLDEMLTLVMSGTLRIRRGDDLHEQQFNNPRLSGLEDLIRTAGFEVNEINELCTLLRSLTKVNNSIQEDIFKEVVTYDVDDTVVIDIVPDFGHVDEFMKDFDACVEQYDWAMSVHKVLAYCPMQKLSQRVMERNRQAELNNNPKNKRIGTFPFNQLGALVQAYPTEDKRHCLNPSLTKDDVFEIVRQHRRAQGTQSPVILDNPFDPDALNNSIAVEVPVNVVNDDTVQLNLSNDFDEVSPSLSTPARIDTAAMIKEYRALTTQLGFQQDQELSQIDVRDGLGFDQILDMSQSSPDELAQTLVNQIDGDKIESTTRISM